jgi:hypothetical protein
LWPSDRIVLEKSDTLYACPTCLGACRWQRSRRSSSKPAEKPIGRGGGYSWEVAGPLGKWQQWPLGKGAHSSSTKLYTETTIRSELKLGWKETNILNS